MELSWVLFCLCIVGGLFIGAICGIVAAASLGGIKRRLEGLEREIVRLRAAWQSRPVPLKPEAAPEEPSIPARAAPEAEPAAEKPPEAAEPWWTLPTPSFAFEQTLGTKWLVWVGVALLIIGGGYFLKYAYDNAWIGPMGRLAIGALASVVALVLGERFRRKDWKVLFQSLTGGGLAGFYTCVFFSFQVYHLTGQGLAMFLAIVVTALAVTLAVMHDAVAIAILAVIGGFLSPVLLSTGANHPYALFTYIAILDLVAMGAAYFRRWRALDVLTFAATALLYKAWHAKFYGAPGQPDQMPPALLYATVFYLMYLAIPMLHSLVRRIPEQPEGLALLASNAYYSLYSYYSILYVSHRQALGFVVLGQALLVFVLFKLWLVRQRSDRYTAESLLIIGLTLVTLAIPLQLRLYAIPVGWAAEACALVYLGIRFGRITLRLGGAAALILAACGLFYRLPLHKVAFTPIFNAPFGSWALVAAAAVAIGCLSLRNRQNRESGHLTVGAFLLGFALGCVLLSIETTQFWTVNHWEAAGHDTHAFSSLTALWAIIAAATAGILARRGLLKWMPLSLICGLIGGGIFLIGLEEYNLRSSWFALNAVFPFRLAFIVSLWWIAGLFRRQAKETPGTVIAIAGHALLTLLLTVEMGRWGKHCDWVSSRMALSLVSALWGLQAFLLVALGLHRRNRVNRIAGFILFGLTVGKVFLVDMSELEKVYRIVSFIASGFFLVLAGYFYQRYSARLLKEETERTP